MILLLFGPLVLLAPFFGLRLRVWIVSFFIVSGRLTLWSLKYRPHALHTFSPLWFLRHKEVLTVPQLAHWVPSRRLALSLCFGVANPSRRFCLCEKDPEPLIKADWFLLLRGAWGVMLLYEGTLYGTGVGFPEMLEGLTADPDAPTPKPISK